MTAPFRAGQAWAEESIDYLVALLGPLNDDQVTALRHRLAMAFYEGATWQINASLREKAS